MQDSDKMQAALKLVDNINQLGMKAGLKRSITQETFLCYRIPTALVLLMVACKLVLCALLERKGTLLTRLHTRAF